MAEGLLCVWRQVQVAKHDFQLPCQFGRRWHVGFAIVESGCRVLYYRDLNGQGVSAAVSTLVALLEEFKTMMATSGYFPTSALAFLSFLPRMENMALN